MYVLNGGHVPETVLGSGGTSVNKADFTVLMEFTH